MKKLYTVLVVFAMVFWVFSGDCFPESTIRTQHFEIVHDGVRASYAEIAARSAEQSYKLITGTLGHAPVEVITIIITHNIEQFRELTRGILPDWSTAAAIPGNRIIISPLEGHKIDLERIIAHEIVHCIINDAAGKTFVPRWFHEGCAENLSGEWGVKGKAYMAWRVIRGNLLTFTDIQQVFSSGSEDATLAYDQSMLAVRRLLGIYGSNVLGEIISGLVNGLDFPSAFHNATLLWPEEYESDYVQYIEKNYGRRSLVTLVPGTWTAILLLSVFVYMIKKFRNKRLLRQWEEAENAGNIIDFTSFPPDDDL